MFADIERRREKSRLPAKNVSSVLAPAYVDLEISMVLSRFSAIWFCLNEGGLAAAADDLDEDAGSRLSPGSIRPVHDGVAHGTEVAAALNESTQ